MTDSIALANDAAAIAGAIMGSSVLNRNLSPRSAGRKPRALPTDPRNPHERSSTFDVSPSKSVSASDMSPSTVTFKSAIASSTSKQASSLDDEEVDELEPLEDVNPDSWLEADPNSPSDSAFVRNSASYRTFTKQARHKQIAQPSVAPIRSPLAAAISQPLGGDQTTVAEVTSSPRKTFVSKFCAPIFIFHLIFVYAYPHLVIGNFQQRFFDFPFNEYFFNVILQVFLRLISLSFNLL